MNRGGLKLFFNRKGGGLNEAGVAALRVLEIPLKGEFHFSGPVYDPAKFIMKSSKIS